MQGDDRLLSEVSRERRRGSYVRWVVLRDLEFVVEVRSEGFVRLVQIAVPIEVARSVASGGHGLGAARLEIRPFPGGPDHHLANLICRAAAPPELEGEEEVLREIVADLVARHST